MELQALAEPVHRETTHAASVIHNFIKKIRHLALV
jgi:hypothetical protein